jgi:hypothetical protein
MPILRIKECISEGPCKGESHEWRFDAPTLKETRIMQSNGLTLGQFEAGLNDISGEYGPQAATALLYLLHHRDGLGVRWNDIDAKLDELDFEPTPEEQAQYDAAVAEAKAAAGEPGKDEAGEPSENPTSGDPTGAAS